MHFNLSTQIMADDAPDGVFFDDLSKIRVLDPDVSQQTQELKEECKEFVDKIAEFQKIVGGFINMVDSLAKEVEQEKMKAIGSRNLLKSMEKERESQGQQLQSVIAEKKSQLARYQVMYEALLKQDSEQTDFVEQFMMQK